MELKNRFPDACRLKNKQSIDYVFASRQKKNAVFFSLRYRKNDSSMSRLGVLISKKNVRLSVNRNRIRRIIREQFRTHLIKNRYYDLIVVVYKQASDATNHELRECVNKLFNTFTA